MYTRVLVPLDGSKLAEQVLPYVRTVAKGLHAPVELLSIFQPVAPEAVGPNHGPSVESVTTNIRMAVYSYLDEVAATLRRQGIVVSCAVREDEPATSIITVAKREPGTLIAMTTHGHSGITRWALGSVTEKVLHALAAPVLAVRAGATISPERVTLEAIIVPLDGSPAAEQVLPHTVALAQGLGLRISLVRVVPLAAEYPANLYEGLVREQTAEEAKEYLRQAGQRVRLRAAGLAVEETVLRGHPAGAIVELAQVSPGALVAMTAQGRSGVRHWALGSVTDRVVRYSGSPVLVIPVVAEEDGRATS